MTGASPIRAVLAGMVALAALPGMTRGKKCALPIAEERLARLGVEAEKEVLEALSKDPKNADTLANAITASLHLNKPTERYVTQLRGADPHHPVVRKLDALEEKFAKAAAAF